MSSSPRYHVRQADSATPRDGEFIVAAFDSTLPYLASIGSHEQWGLTPFFQREGWTDETLGQVKDAETYRLTGMGDALRIFIVEAYVRDDPLDAEDAGGPGSVLGDGAHGESVDGHAVSVGFAFVRENWLPGYIISQDHLTVEDGDRESCLYIEVMAADHRVDEAIRKGSGAALIQGIKEYGRETGKQKLFVDGWAGNGKQLIRFVVSSPSR